MKLIGQEIVDVANSFIGQEEIRGNQGFKDEDFEILMEAVGWETGQAWCAYFGEIVWKIAYQKQNSLFYSKLDTLFSAGAVATYTNFRRSSSFQTGETPSKGALAVWQKYHNGRWSWHGHMGIVVDWDDYTVTTVDGNTSKEGSREGIIVSDVKRDINFVVREGLVLKGFVYPASPQSIV